MKTSEHTKELLAETYRLIYTIRRFEEEGVKLYRQGLIRGYYHPYWGEEAIAVGICNALTGNDYIASSHRGHGHCIAWGADIKRMFAELLGKKTGFCKGLGGSMHIADVTKGNLGANGIVGSGVPIAVGAAMGAKIRKEDRVAAVFVSDGGTNIGSFSEGLNLAAAFKLPVLFIIENNQYAVSTKIEDSTGEPELYKRGKGYGVPGERIDGNHVVEVYEAAVKAVAYCRSGKGPYIIEGLTFRQSGHHVNDPGTYMPEDKVAYYQQHDPIKICKQYMLDHGWNEPAVKQIEEQVEQEITTGINYAKDSEELTNQEFLTFIETY
ncbi:MAG: thiamine pyrophosphate-dependent dehydrogenase E1 component subunit alpha [Candidatus Cyclobacteriaceae bacterium M3_2C_046]